jgi:hypothetical protein
VTTRHGVCDRHPARADRGNDPEVGQGKELQLEGGAGHRPRQHRDEGECHDQS